ncbi:MAG: carboxylating nicotinate-nucleotide diphosphorylase [Endozoicomonadaceae bacterium]|nr:carboxylating nicotinate-nucleotide diphosphorylase [Endozoicomonadaceae bacterium]
MSISPELHTSQALQDAIILNVRNALAEDIGTGDITANLIPTSTTASARIITREAAIVCGRPWVDEVFRQMDADIDVEWLVNDGEPIHADQTLVNLHGAARSLLTAERCALNFLQLLSGTATTCHHYVNLVQGVDVRLLDTRKTIPGLRLAQKYAVTCGGCHNHRAGLYDAFLIKENHIAACGGIFQAVQKGRKQAPGKPIEIEVESLAELEQALDASADTIMLDNFTLPNLRQAVAISDGRAKLEASGGITEATLRPIAETGVDSISIGLLTKHCRSVDLSMRITG